MASTALIFRARVAGMTPASRLPATRIARARMPVPNEIIHEISNPSCATVTTW